MDDASRAARALWTLYEPVHAVTYFAPEARAAFETTGLRGVWRGYFAGRAAPLGAAGPGAVASAFFSFAPAMVRRAVPGVWDVLPPDRALEARCLGASAALRRMLAGREAAVERAAALLSRYARDVDVAGRPLAAANLAVAAPEEPYALLWHAATVLREHRGDGHLAALVAAGLDGCEILVLRAGHDLPRTESQPYRGWTDAEWEAAAGRLCGRGLLDPAGTATPAGLETLAAVERATDLAAARPWRGLPPGAADRLAEALGPLGRVCAGALRFPNPIGVPAPDPAPDGSGVPGAPGAPDAPGAPETPAAPGAPAPTG
ncbi:hypothetical protein NX801_16845 [Streptomyces sp. LP05-1]|uniref:SalK n=1 Tax=Streptomyces pyxinae TaxID=2970734 RepID=A0ABT2CIQ9_9ACTN|nr:hypothetical protein [Streptomyces sp. LP05-1]MCS0637302.1 hypothetical protein [Streptomyces sp. LP05-1]